MGLSSFNAMRARMKEEAEALKSANVEVKETLPESVVEVAKEKVVEETPKDESKTTRKTDAEKLKKKKE